jgi:hypothetical protein
MKIFIAVLLTAWSFLKCEGFRLCFHLPQLVADCTGSSKQNPASLLILTEDRIRQRSYNPSTFSWNSQTCLMTAACFYANFEDFGIKNLRLGTETLASW